MPDRDRAPARRRQLCAAARRRSSARLQSRPRVSESGRAAERELSVLGAPESPRCGRWPSLSRKTLAAARAEKAALDERLAVAPPHLAARPDEQRRELAGRAAPALVAQQEERQRELAPDSTARTAEQQRQIREPCAPSGSASESRKAEVDRGRERVPAAFADRG